MKTTNPFIASVSDQSGEMVELIPQDSQTLTADERLRELLNDLQAITAYAKNRTVMVGDINVGDLHFRLLDYRAALNQGQG